MNVPEDLAAALSERHVADRANPAGLRILAALGHAAASGQQPPRDPTDPAAISLSDLIAIAGPAESFLAEHAVLEAVTRQLPPVERDVLTAVAAAHTAAAQSAGDLANRQVLADNLARFVRASRLDEQTSIQIAAAAGRLMRATGRSAPQDASPVLIETIRDPHDVDYVAVYGLSFDYDRAATALLEERGFFHRDDEDGGPPIYRCARVNSGAFTTADQLADLLRTAGRTVVEIRTEYPSGTEAAAPLVEQSLPRRWLRENSEEQLTRSLHYAADLLESGESANSLSAIDDTCQVWYSSDDSVQAFDLTTRLKERAEQAYHRARREAGYDESAPSSGAAPSVEVEVALLRAAAGRPDPSWDERFSALTEGRPVIHLTRPAHLSPAELRALTALEAQASQTPQVREELLPGLDPMFSLTLWQYAAFGLMRAVYRDPAQAAALPDGIERLLSPEWARLVDSARSLAAATSAPTSAELEDAVARDISTSGVPAIVRMIVRVRSMAATEFPRIPDAQAALALMRYAADLRDAHVDGSCDLTARDLFDHCVKQLELPPLEPEYEQVMRRARAKFVTYPAKAGYWQPLIEEALGPVDAAALEVEISSGILMPPSIELDEAPPPLGNRITVDSPLVGLVEQCLETFKSDLRQLKTREALDAAQNPTSPLARELRDGIETVQANLTALRADAASLGLIDTARTWPGIADAAEDSFEVAVPLADAAPAEIAAGLDRPVVLSPEAGALLAALAQPPDAGTEPAAERTIEIAGVPITVRNSGASLLLAPIDTAEGALGAHVPTSFVLDPDAGLEVASEAVGHFRRLVAALPELRDQELERAEAAAAEWRSASQVLAQISNQRSDRARSDLVDLAERNFDGACARLAEITGRATPVHQSVADLAAYTYEATQAREALYRQRAGDPGAGEVLAANALAALHRMRDRALTHMPPGVEGIEAFSSRFPGPQLPPSATPGQGWTQ